MTLSDQYLGACRLRGKDVSKFISKWITPTTHSKTVAKAQIQCSSKIEFTKLLHLKKTSVSTSSKAHITIANLKIKWYLSVFNIHRPYPVAHTYQLISVSPVIFMSSATSTPTQSSFPIMVKQQWSDEHNLIQVLDREWVILRNIILNRPEQIFNNFKNSNVKITPMQHDCHQWNELFIAVTRWHVNLRIIFSYFRNSQLCLYATLHMKMSYRVKFPSHHFSTWPYQLA